MGCFFFTLGWYICSAISLHIQIQHPLASADDPSTDSVPYLVVRVKYHVYCGRLANPVAVRLYS